VTAPDGKLYQYEYDSEQRLVQVTYPGQTFRQYHYEHSGYPDYALTGITDENGDRYASFSYDAQGQAVTTEHAQTTNGSPQE